ncbi:hypothetical protein CBR_g38713 [Chara braunii]|uniref:ABC transmembrane type-1 domain-containing protein n=1 Tax=Chara braunii TaxID=69332 RepID=A0A388LQ22_CHABU|nr:hypothetical protein CBR_g38713 [Chara braunii]|eukprot:GBG84428.1 hypothetical protein CBR_g38713 [Chara braunii]
MYYQVGLHGRRIPAQARAGKVHIALVVACLMLMLGFGMLSVLSVAERWTGCGGADKSNWDCWWKQIVSCGQDFEVPFRSSQLLAWMAMLALTRWDVENGSQVYSSLLRIWWIVSFFLTTVCASSAVVRFVERSPSHSDLFVDDIVSFITWPISFFLFFAATLGRTGIRIEEPPISCYTEPLLEGEEEYPKPELTLYATAGLLKRLFFLWMNPLLQKGKARPFELEDIPVLSTQHRCGEMFKVFQKNWEKQKNMGLKPSIGRTLMGSFWKAFLVSVLVRFAHSFLVGHDSRSIGLVTFGVI